MMSNQQQPQYCSERLAGGALACPRIATQVGSDGKVRCDEHYQRVMEAAAVDASKPMVLQVQPPVQQADGQTRLTKKQWQKRERSKRSSRARAAMRRQAR